MLLELERVTRNADKFWVSLCQPKEVRNEHLEKAGGRLFCGRRGLIPPAITNRLGRAKPLHLLIDAQNCRPRDLFSNKVVHAA